MRVDRFWYANESAAVPAIWHYGSGTFALICLFLGIISNGLVIFVFIRNDVLQKPRNYFLINLAITDLGLLLTNNSMHVISSFKRQWIFGQAGCNFYSVCGGIFGLTSITTMAAIAVNRLGAVNDPFSSLKLGSCFTINCLLGAWLYGTIWILPPLFGWNRFILEGFGTTCTFDYVSKDIWDRTFILVLIIGGFLVPLLVIAISYTLILMKLSQRSRRFTSQNNDDNYPTNLNSSLFFNQLNSYPENRNRTETSMSVEFSVDDNSMNRNVRRTEARATRTALYICVIFCSAWGPYTIVALLSVLGCDRCVNAYSTAVLGLFTKLAACINPLVYALSLSGFREQLCAYFSYWISCDQRQQLELITSGHADTSRRKFPTLPDSSTSRQSEPTNRWHL